MLELGGVVAAVLYLVLSLYYDRFYTRLGIEPGDVGLDRSAIVSRAVGGVIAMIGLVAVVSLALSLLAFVTWVFWRGYVWLLRKMTPAAAHQSVEEQLRHLWDKDWIRYTSLAVPAFGLINPNRPRPTRSDVTVGFAVFSAVGLYLVLLIGWTEVEDAADAAAKGDAVAPLTFAKIRVLDIESRPCSVEWLGGNGDHVPAALKASELRCLGSANGVAVFRLGTSTITVPASQIAITLK